MRQRLLDDDGSAIVSWLEQGGGAGRVMARRVSAAGVPDPVTQVAQGTRDATSVIRVWLHAGTIPGSRGAIPKCKPPAWPNK